MIGEFERCNAVTLSYEGGNDDDPHDKGGRTSRGITQREWDSYRRAHSERALAQDVWKAPQSDVVAIYRGQYWNPVRGDQWPIGVDLCVYDAGVNSGIGRALTWARATLGQGAGTFQLLAAAAASYKDSTTIVHRYQARRLGFLEALRTWAYFGRGWARRVAGIESIAVKWIAQAAGHPPEIVSVALQSKASQAANKSKAAGGGAVAAPAAPAAHHQLVTHDAWLHYTVDVVLLVGACVLVAWLLHTAYIHAVRAQAFTEAAK